MIWVKCLIMTVSAAILCLFSLFGCCKLGIAGSVVLLAVFALFLLENIRSAKLEMVTAEGEKREKPSGREIAVNVIKFVVGAAGIVIGANLLVNNGSELARLLGVSETIISVTLIAVGTSLPELVTAISALVKKQSSISVGNIIGANIIDLTVILPVNALVAGGSLPIAAQSVSLDMPVCLGVALLATLPLIISERFRRYQGVLLLAAYVTYVVVMIIR